MTRPPKTLRLCLGKNIVRALIRNEIESNFAEIFAQETSSSGEDMTQPSHIHSVLDGRGSRQFFVNGHEIERVSYADERKGIVKYYHNPVRINWRKGEFVEGKLRGKVEVKFVQ